jgi:hypothetical protein
MVNSLNDIKKLREYGNEDKPIYKALIRLLNGIQIYVPDEKISFIYPKRLFGNNKEKLWDGTDLEVVMLTANDQIVIADIEEDQGFEINIYHKSEIASITVNGNINQYNQVNSSAVLRFKDGNDLILNSEEDTNEYWVKGYSNVINSIVKQLLQSPNRVSNASKAVRLSVV